MRKIDAATFRPERVAELRTRRQLSRDELALLARVSPETVRAAEMGLRVPSARVVAALATALGTTVQYLCPASGAPGLQELRRRIGLTQREIARAVGVSSQMVSRVEAGIYGVRQPDRWAAGYQVTREVWTAAWEAGREAHRKSITAKGESEQCPNTSESGPSQ